VTKRDRMKLNVLPARRPGKRTTHRKFSDTPAPLKKYSGAVGLFSFLWAD